MPRDPILLLGQMTTADPTRSPEGTESVWAYTHLPRRWADDEVAIARQVERMEDAVERVAPGFRSIQRARQVQSPGDLQAGGIATVFPATAAGENQMLKAGG